MIMQKIVAPLAGSAGRNMNHAVNIAWLIVAPLAGSAGRNITHMYGKPAIRVAPLAGSAGRNLSNDTEEGRGVLCRSPRGERG